MYTTKQSKISTPRNKIEKKESKTVVSTEVFSVCVINFIFFNVQIFYLVLPIGTQSFVFSSCLTFCVGFYTVDEKPPLLILACPCVRVKLVVQPCSSSLSSLKTLCLSK